MYAKANNSYMYTA